MAASYFCVTCQGHCLYELEGVCVRKRQLSLTARERGCGIAQSLIGVSDRLVMHLREAAPSVRKYSDRTSESVRRTYRHSLIDYTLKLAAYKPAFVSLRQWQCQRVS